MNTKEVNKSKQFKNHGNQLAESNALIKRFDYDAKKDN